MAATNAARARGAVCNGRSYGPAPALTVNAQLTQAAQAHTQDMANNDRMTHTGSDGSTLRVRVDRTGYAWSTLGENVAAGYTTPQAVVNGWLSSTSGHCESIMNPSFRHIGVGYAYTAAGRYHHYWTQDFGAP